MKLLKLTKAAVLETINEKCNAEKIPDHNDMIQDCFEGEETDNDKWEQLEYYLSEEQLGWNGLITINDEGITLQVGPSTTIQNFLEKDFHMISNLISWAYDTSHKEGNEVWDMMNLGGDDDVDYNSSYLDIIIEVICATANIEDKGTEHHHFNMDNKNNRTIAINLYGSIL